MPLPHSVGIETVKINRTLVIDALLPGIDLMFLEDVQYFFPNRLPVLVHFSVHIPIFGLDQNSTYIPIGISGAIVQLVESFNLLDDFPQRSEAKLEIQARDPILRLFLLNFQLKQIF